eukprot:CAMPEP_0117657574 /NCGR_PEP_ID=MMETSP0804-20121206/5404_1 /TAXON_ID=1074897 /ORGANISM="Tetraselmis astigmatica, Strain CCMP880" /LENGTH=476 /DNA_ID=CAMNT_0005464039 /DNA_START=78 /DNA_END=1509 /DNA_ORIENTATION=-
MEKDEELYMDADNLITDDPCSEDEDEFDAKINEEHKKFLLLSEEQSTKLRARSAPAIGSPSSAKQRKRSAERLQASQIQVESDAPREDYIPASEKGPRPPTAWGWSSLAREIKDSASSWLETVAEERGALPSEGSMAGSILRSPSLRLPSGNGSEESAVAAEATVGVVAPPPADPYSLAMELFESDFDSPVFQYTSSTSKPGAKSTRRPRSAGPATELGGKSAPSAIAAQGLLGLRTPSKKERSKPPHLKSSIPALALTAQPSAVMSEPSLLVYRPKIGLRPQSAHQLGHSSQPKTPRPSSPKKVHPLVGSPRREPRGWGSPDKSPLPPPRHVFKDYVDNRGFQPLGWNDKYAVKVNNKIKEANNFNNKLGLKSTYRLITARRVGSDDNVAVEVSTTAKGEPAVRVVSIQAFLNTHNRLRKLATMRRRPRPNSQIGLSPAARNQADFQAEVDATQGLCNVLSDQIALLKQLGMMQT